MIPIDHSGGVPYGLTWEEWKTIEEAEALTARR